MKKIKRNPKGPFFSKITSKGQITLIKSLREKLMLEQGDMVIMELRNNNELVIKKAEIKPIE